MGILGRVVQTVRQETAYGAVVATVGFYEIKLSRLSFFGS
jgi:hypothetical protein